MLDRAELYLLYCAILPPRMPIISFIDEGIGEEGMTYSAYDYAIELGFTEAEARALQACNDGQGAPPENILRIAKRKNLPSTKPDYPMPPSLALDILQSMASPVTSKVKGKASVKRRKSTKRRGVKEG